MPCEILTHRVYLNLSLKQTLCYSGAQESIHDTKSFRTVSLLQASPYSILAFSNMLATSLAPSRLCQVILQAKFGGFLALCSTRESSITQDKEPDRREPKEPRQVTVLRWLDEEFTWNHGHEYDKALVTAEDQHDSWWVLTGQTRGSPANDEPHMLCWCVSQISVESIVEITKTAQLRAI